MKWFFSFIQVNEGIEGDEEVEWDNGNEIDEVEKNLHLYDDDDDDGVDNDDDDVDDWVVMDCYVFQYLLGKLLVVTLLSLHEWILKIFVAYYYVV